MYTINKKKEIEMKKLIALSFLLFLIGYGKEVDTLLERNGIKYEINSTTPYTGKFKENYYNGKLKVEESYKKGKLEGVRKRYSATGKLWNEGNYKKGKQEGLFKWYFETGKLEQEENFKNGKLEGIVEFYYATGKLKEKEIYKNGKLLKKVN